MSIRCKIAILKLCLEMCPKTKKISSSFFQNRPHRNQSSHLIIEITINSTNFLLLFHPKLQKLHSHVNSLCLNRVICLHQRVFGLYNKRFVQQNKKHKVFLVVTLQQRKRQPLQINKIFVDFFVMYCVYNRLVYRF